MPFDAEEPRRGGGGSCPKCGGYGLVRGNPVPCIRADLALPDRPVFLHWGVGGFCPDCVDPDEAANKFLCRFCFGAGSRVVEGMIACCCKPDDQEQKIQYYGPVVLQVECKCRKG